MKRLGTVLVTVIALLAFAPAAGAASPRENFDTIGFDAFGSVCGQQTCTDTNLFADSQTTASGETFTFSCADQFTYNIRNGRGNGNGGCTESLDFNVADDLSSASLPPTQYEVCGRGHCTTITVSAELQAIGPAASFRARSTRTRRDVYVHVLGERPPASRQRDSHIRRGDRRRRGFDSQLERVLYVQMSIVPQTR